VRLPDFVRTTTFVWTLAVSGAFVLCTLVLFGFVYWQTDAHMKSRIDDVLVDGLRIIAADPPERRLAAIEARLNQDPRRIRIAGLFAGDGHRIAGNMESLPGGLAPDVPADAVIVRIDNRGRETQKVRLIAQPLPGGEVLVIGRNIDELPDIAAIVARALALGLLPAFGLALAIGMVLSKRALNRLSEVNRRIKLIMAGHLRERLPTHGGDDPFEQLALGVNRMLGEIETLIQEIAGVGDDIAHDLRTPLTRVRVRLERGREHAATLEELRAAVDQAIAGLDQSLAIITALLRIAEIEHGRRLEGFSEVRLVPLLREVGDLYDPIAEDKHVTLRVEAAGQANVHGDRDLLFEAVTNLVDNAVKYTPEGGRVTLALLRRDGECAIRVSDTGAGIPEFEHAAVTKRFYRSDKSRRTEGLGLGLSLVAAIVKLHAFRLTMTTGPGCTAEIVCPQWREAALRAPDRGERPRETVSLGA
jgi:signal transduction histidine kinase